MVLSLQGRCHRFKSCSAHKPFFKNLTVKNTKNPTKFKNMREHLKEILRGYYKKHKII